ncbi:uncharacterized protein LOC111341850 [Stylophora pistillata]|uniref:uncharacterized protein LOC111341850 n=1 Tax=Stylophora pistillata TaxID=50429 RepID=UPI000C042191|nr:uncharacterized protein LOC111341850 [Stylophora pistillata]
MREGKIEEILVLTEEEENTPLFVSSRARREVQIFAGRVGIQWKILRCLFAFLYPISHVTIIVSLISFFVTAFSFAINCALEMTFEMISPQGDSSAHQNLYTCCLLMFLCCTMLFVCLVFSLFWEIIKVAVVKSTLIFRKVKVVVFLAIFMGSGIYAGCVRTSFGVMMTLLSSCLAVCWFAAFIVAVLGSIGLLVFCYREESHEAYAMVLLPLCIPLVLFSILAPISFTLVDASTGAVCFAFFYPFLTACLILYICFRGSRKPNGEQFVMKRRFAVFFTAAYLAVLILMVTSRAYSENSCNLPSVNHFKAINFSISKKYQPKYPICDKTWTPLRLNVAEIAYLSFVTYQTNWNRQDLSKSINSYFLHREGQWNVSYMSDGNPRFYHLFEATRKVHIIGIRGSVSAGEWFEYLKLWSEVISYQLTSEALPVQRFPLSFVTSYVSASSFLERILHHNRPDYSLESIESYIKRENLKSKGIVLLTGHSFGGGLAKIIGSRQQIQAVSFSSPGEVYISKKLDFSLEDLQRYATSVVLRDDLVTWVDHHGGLVQYISRNANQHVSCHAVNIYCELKRSCGFQTPIPC